MYLKEAFRYQNYLGNLISNAYVYLGNPKYITQTVQLHLRNKANPEAEDEMVDMVVERELHYTADQIVDFLLHLVDEKQKLTKAISTAKKYYYIDIDAELANNKVRQTASAVLFRMGNVKPIERTSKGYAYKFNADGNQVQYTYDINETTTIDFDRDRVKSVYRDLSRQADEASAAIDRAMVELEVDHTPVYSINDSFEDAIEQFVSSCVQE